MRLFCYCNPPSLPPPLVGEGTTHRRATCTENWPTKDRPFCSPAENENTTKYNNHAHVQCEEAALCMHQQHRNNINFFIYTVGQDWYLEPT